MYCHNCGFEVNGEQRFCAKCGAQLKTSQINVNAPPVLNAAMQKQPVLINGKKAKLPKIIAAAIILLIVMVTLTNFHRCPECEEIYFGKRYTISWFGEKEKVCKDCYKDYYLSD